MNKKKLIELRCKAWGITEDEYYCNQCSDFSLEDMARAYRRGKNKGARDKAIQNIKFYQKQMEDIYDKKNKQIAELEKENAELKDYRLNTLKEQQTGIQKYALNLEHKLNWYDDKLTKAKELLERLLITSCNSDVLNLLPNYSEVLRVRVEAEQFIKDSEVEK